MKRTTLYHLVLDNEQRFDIETTSAANAMQMTLERNPGRTILKCWSGRDYAIRDRSIKGDGAAGIIDYEVPRHIPFIAAPKVKAKDKTSLMFDDAEILAQSKKAMGAA